MGDVVILGVETTLPVPPERVLAGAIDAGLEAVLIIGLEKDGCLYFASSTPERPELLWLIEKAKARLLE